jgi:hypothetical protein
MSEYQKRTRARKHAGPEASSGHVTSELDRFKWEAIVLASPELTDAVRAGRMPGLAALVPSWIEVITVLVDADKTGQENSHALATAPASRREGSG